jgi:site-specific DNA-cytosine methylase
MNVLELFSGTHSIGKVCKQLGWNPISVDLELPATHECDIMDFDYKQYPKDYFSIIWASPPCTYYSTLQNCWLGQKKKGMTEPYTKEQLELDRLNSDKLILKTFEIIDYFNPELWCLENPQTGVLKNRDIMKYIPYYDVSYCMYCNWGYEKRTRIWTNKKDWNNKLCDRSGSCGNMINCKHKLNVANDVHTVGHRKKHRLTMGGNRGTDPNQKYVKGGGANRLDRYRIPENLIFSLFLD